MASRVAPVPVTASGSVVPAPAPAPTAIGPVRGQERIDAIDILRGVAILGILVVNMGLFATATDQPAHGVVDRLILFFAQEKFKTLFAFLFGLGLAVQVLRAEARGVRFVPLYARRLIVLFLIGCAHSLLIWDGDILHDYAQLGAVLLLFRRRSLRTLLVCAGLCFAVPVVYYGLTTYAAITGHSSAPLKQWMAYENEDGVGDSEEAVARSYAHGGYGDMVALRARELPRDLLPDADDAFVFAIFLLGLYVGRRRILQATAAQLPLIRRVQRWGLGVGLACNAVFAAGGAFDPEPSSVLQNVGRLCLVFGAPALALCYASTIVLATQHATWRRRLAPLAAVGRTALSNYLLQSLICTTIFYHYGFGLFGTVGPTVGLLLSISIFSIQIPLSVWWLRRFQFGPVEWLWRSLTYWHRQPMRLAGTPEVA